MLTIPLEPAETSADFGPAVAAPVEVQDIETTTPIDEEAGLKALFPVALPAESAKATAENSKAPAEDSELPSPAVESGIYVQHASFRLPQSALIWKKQ